MYINFSNAQFSFIHGNLRSRCLLGRNLGNCGIEGGTLLGVGEVLKLEDLNFPVLLDEREDEDTIVVPRGTINKSDPGCALRCSGQILWSR
jgi:hypothetical protein